MLPGEGVGELTQPVLPLGGLPHTLSRPGMAAPNLEGQMIPHSLFHCEGGTNKVCRNHKRSGGPTSTCNALDGNLTSLLHQGSHRPSCEGTDSSRIHIRYILVQPKSFAINCSFLGWLCQKGNISCNSGYKFKSTYNNVIKIA